MLGRRALRNRMGDAANANTDGLERKLIAFRQLSYESWDVQDGDEDIVGKSFQFG